MTEPSEHPPPPPPPGSHVGRRLGLVLGLVAGVAVVVVVGAVWLVREATEAPSFPSVAEQTEPALQGTAVYDDYGCLRAVPLTGGEPVELTCEKDTEVMLVESARFLDGGDLEVVLVAEATPYRRLVFAFDAGSVRQVSDEALDEPPAPLPTPTGPDGATARSVTADGTVEVVVSGPEGERTLLRAEAPDTYFLGDPLWVPDGSALVVHDAADRLLVITTAEQPTTRVLQEGAAQVWAVTDQDLLGSA